MSSQYGELQPTNSWDRFWEFGAPQQISTSFAPWCHYCTDVAHRRPTKLCTMFGHLLGWYTIQALSGTLGKIHFAFKACILLYWLQQCASAKLCGMVQGMELQNFCRGRHLYFRLGGHHAGHRPTFLVATLMLARSAKEAQTPGVDSCTKWRWLILTSLT